MNRDEKIAAAKRKLKQFKQKRTKPPKNAKDVIKPNNETISNESSVESQVNGKVEENFSTNLENGSNQQQKHSVIPDLESVETINQLESRNNNFQSVVESSKSLVNPASQERTMPELFQSYDSEQKNVSKENIESNQATHDNTATTASNIYANVEQVSDEAKDHQRITENLISFSEEDSANNVKATESLLQISTKLNGIAAEVDSVTNQHIHNGDTENNMANHYVLSELESRNQKLAEQVAIITRQKSELGLQVEMLSEQLSQLHTRLDTERQQIQSQNIQEQNVLRQQIQVQMQTIGILVAEKQEMQHQVHEARTSATHDQHTRQRCQDELRDAMVKLQTLERELALKSDNFDMLTVSKSEVDSESKNLRQTVTKLTKSNDESSMHIDELTHKLNVKDSECNRLNTQVEDLNEKLAMAEVLLQQLSTSSGETAENQVQLLQTERESLNQKLIEYQQAFEQLTSEREQLSRQYEDVNKQMQSQVADLSQQVEQLENDKSSLESEQQTLLSRITQMEERQSQELENTQVSQNAVPATSEEDTRRMQELQQHLERISLEREELSNKLNAQMRNNERLARLNEEQELQLTELTQSASETSVSSDEYAKLLEQSQNDKATISRALMQNKQLKQQLEEMHDGFIKLSNDKMELANQLSTIDHSAKEKDDENEQLKNYMSQIKLELEAKSRTVLHLQNSFAQQESSRKDIANSSIASTTSTAINEEIETLEDTVKILSEQNNQLKEMVSNLQQKIDTTPSVSTPVSTSLSDVADITTGQGASEEVVSQLNRSIADLQEEKSILIRRLEQQKTELERSSALQESANNESRPSSDLEVSMEEHESLVKNMSLLQDRFTKVMTEKVDALSKVEELEHINLQLQNECDTIGEYITLYHNQRQLLKQRHHEKDEYVSSIAQEREVMQQKLEKLQTLVRTLVNAKERRRQSEAEQHLSSTPQKQSGANFISDSISLQETAETSPSDWPDMSEDDEVRQRIASRPDILPDNAPLSGESPCERSPTSEPHPGKTTRLEAGGEVPEAQQTASQIMSLLEQMQKPNYLSGHDRPQGFCLKYMGRYTAI